MKKISLIIIGALLAVASNLTLAASADNADAQQGKWSVKLGLDVATEDSLDKGILVGGSYSNYNKYLNAKYNFGIAVTSGRTDTCFPPTCVEEADLSYDGVIIDANLAYDIDKYYVFAGLNYPIISQSVSVIYYNVRDTGINVPVDLKIENDGIGYQIGSGLNIGEQVALEISYQSIPLKGVIDETVLLQSYTERLDIDDFNTTQLAINYSF